MKTSYNLLILIFLVFNLNGGSLEDLRRSLNKDSNSHKSASTKSIKQNNMRQLNTLNNVNENKTENVVSSQKESKLTFEIKNMQPRNVQGYYLPKDKGQRGNLFGMHVIFKVLDNSNSISVNKMVCYFFDKEKNLINKQNASMLFDKTKSRPQEISGPITVSGMVNTQIIFCYEDTFKFNYAVCVIGNETSCVAKCYPKIAKLENFEFEEKQFVLNGEVVPEPSLEPESDISKDEKIEPEQTEAGPQLDIKE